MTSNKKKKTITLNGKKYKVYDEQNLPYIELEHHYGTSILYLEDLSLLGFKWEYDKD